MENYILLDQIGEGSFGRVHKARRKYTGRIVAIKMISKISQTQDDLESFRREIAILQKVDHPHVMRLLEISETNQDFCIVSELARGDLFLVINDKQTLPESVMRCVAAQLVSALAHLHKHRIIHRDMKPQNILICADGALKVCDFGFARALSNTTLVLSSIKGTPLYMAPELVQENPYNEKVDVWSLGVILYELYFGKPPFFASSIYKLIQMIVNENVRWPKDTNISPGFKDFLSLMLKKNPEERASCDDLLAHEFIAKVALEPFDDSGYMFKKRQFDEAIAEILSTNRPFTVPKESVSDFQSFLHDPGSYSSDQVNAAVVYLGEHEASSQSALAALFTLHFAELVKRKDVAENSLMTATKLLQSDAVFYQRLKSGMCLLGDTEMPFAAVDFFTQILVVPDALRKIDHVGMDIVDFTLDETRACVLRDRMWNFWLNHRTDAADASKIYAFLSYLVQMSPTFTDAISGSSAAEFLPSVTSAVIQKITPAVQAGAFAVLTKTLERNNKAIGFVQPIDELIGLLFEKLETTPSDFGEFCVFGAVMSFLSSLFPVLSQLTSFQQHCAEKRPTSSLKEFIDDICLSRIAELSNALLKFAAERPESGEDYFLFMSMIESPFMHLTLNAKCVDRCIQSFDFVLPFHQPALLRAIFTAPTSEILRLAKPLVRLFDNSVCVDTLASMFLQTLKKRNDSNLVSVLIKNDALLSAAKIIANNGSATPGSVVSLLTFLVISTKTATPELSEQAGDIIRSVFGVPECAEAAVIIGAHLARVSPKFLKVLDECNALQFAEAQLQKGNESTKLRAMSLIGNICKHEPMRIDLARPIIKLLVDELAGEDDKVAKKYAAYAVGNAIYHHPECGDVVVEKLDAITPLLDSKDVKEADMIDNVVGIMCNLVHLHDQHLDALLQSGAVDKILQIMATKDAYGFLVMKRIPMLCKYPKALKIIKRHRKVIANFTTKPKVPKAVKKVAEQVQQIIDATR